MKKILALALALAVAGAYADEKKTEKKPKDKPAAKSDKNVFQKTESSVGQWAHDNKIWMRGSSKK